MDGYQQIVLNCLTTFMDEPNDLVLPVHVADSTADLTTFDYRRRRHRRYDERR